MITLGHYLKPYSKRIALGTVIKIVGTITELFLPWILSYMIDEVAPEKNVARIFLWGAVMLACAVVALLGNITANRMASKVARDTTESMRFDLFDKTLNLSARQTDGFAMPSLVSRLSSDTYNVHNMIGMIQRLGIRAPMLLIGGIVVTFMVEPVLALVLLATMPFLVLLAVLVAKKGTSLYTKLQKTVDTMVRKIRDIYSGIRVIKALSRTEYEKKSFETINKNVSSSETRAGLTTGVTNPIMNLFLNLGMTAVILVGALSRERGTDKGGADNSVYDIFHSHAQRSDFRRENFRYVFKGHCFFKTHLRGAQRARGPFDRRNRPRREFGSGFGPSANPL
mgnify:CR=1 FL=1